MPDDEFFLPTTLSMWPSRDIIGVLGTALMGTLGRLGSGQGDFLIHYDLSDSVSTETLT